MKVWRLLCELRGNGEVLVCAESSKDARRLAAIETDNEALWLDHEASDCSAVMLSYEHVLMSVGTE